MNLSEKEFKALISSHPELIKDKKNIPTQSNESKNKNKYLNIKVYVYEDGVSEERLPNKKCIMMFDSRKEYRRFLELKTLERIGDISELERQKAIEIISKFHYNEEKINGITYKADFCYKNKDGQTVVEDVKPFDERTGKYRTTKDFNLKWKLLKNKYPEFLFVIF